MALDGVNKLCSDCKQECKQWKQITIIKCPNYVKSQKVHLDREGKS